MKCFRSKGNPDVVLNLKSIVVPALIFVAHQVKIRASHRTGPEVRVLLYRGPQRST